MDHVGVRRKEIVHDLKSRNPDDPLLAKRADRMTMEDVVEDLCAIHLKRWGHDLGVVEGMKKLRKDALSITRRMSHYVP